MKETLFHIIPSKHLERGKQVLLNEGNHERYVRFEGKSALADALMLWALVGMENEKQETPIILVNQQDFDEGNYNNFIKASPTE